MNNLTAIHSHISFNAQAVSQYLCYLFLLFFFYEVKAQPTIAGACPVSIIANSNTNCSPTVVWLSTTASAGYSYQWSTGSQEPTIILTSPGTYTVTVTNVLETCTASITINSLSDVQPPTLICPNDTTVALPEGQTSIAIGLNQPTAFDNCSAVVTITNDAPALFPVGETQVTWTATDAVGNSSTCQQMVNVSCNLTVNVVTTPDSGIGDGTATAIVAGGSGTYTYQWNTGATTATITNLVAGFYYVTVTDSNGCKGTGYAEVKPCVITLLGYEDEDIVKPGDSVPLAPELLPEERFVVLKTPCDNNPTGYKVIAVIGPSTNVMYTNNVSVSTNPAGNTEIKFRSAGTYRIYRIYNEDDWFFPYNACITEDGGGNIYSEQGVNITYKVKCKSRKITVGSETMFCAMIAVPPQPNPNIGGAFYVKGPQYAIYNLTMTNLLDNSTTSLPNLSLSDTLGTFNIEFMGSDYEYHLSVTEALSGYQYDTTFVLTPNDVFATNAGNDVSICTNSSAIIGTPAVEDVTYQWSPAIGLSATDIAQPISNPNSTTTYTLTATNEYGCVATDEVTVNVVTPIITIDSIIDQSCNTSGAISTTITGGLLPYTILWSNGHTTANINNLNAGVYTIEVTEANGCTASASATVTGGIVPPSAAVSPASAVISCATPTVTLTALGSGSSYLWSNAAITPSISVSSAGIYTVTATGTNGCKTIKSATITSNTTPPTVTIAGTTNVCAGGGTILLTASSAGIAYNWRGPLGYTATGVTITRTNASALMSGTYTVTITGSNGCTASAGTNITVSVCNSLTATTVVTNNTGANNGTITVSAGGGTPCAGGTYNYAWSGVSSGIGTGVSPYLISGLATGWYYVTITDCAGGSVVLTVYVASQTRTRSKTENSTLEGLTAYPNPTSDATTITFTSWGSEYVTVNVYATDGKQVATLFEGITNAEADYVLPFSVENIPAGVYVVQALSQSGIRQTLRIVVEK